MIVQYASDLHLDYGQNYEYILNKGFEEEGNVLILAGDVANLVALRTYRLFWDLCSSNFWTGALKLRTTSMTKIT